MSLEITIRTKLLNSVEAVYGTNSFNQFKSFFLNKYVYREYDTRKGNRLLKIINDNQVSDNEKFVRLINSIYLSHLLDLVLNYKQFYLNQEIKKTFYYVKPENDKGYKVLSEKRIVIKNLRNDIAHFNFENFVKNRKEYLDALCLFETYIGCNICKLHSLTELGYKPTIKDILTALQNVAPELFLSGKPEGLNRDRDRALLELFDDLAILNGYDCNDLPSPWSILRQKYELTRSTVNH
ncbi:MAG: hypothetical protein A2Y25_09365 [Candidatus Melainabacteria bacterium GWF2_37_15]|nr:MAG: hypothetical protein A2Y25_09365 [Candidatus Melainabacteria bacterium GWF2_37_15]